MVGAIERALSRIYTNIPMELLELIFDDDSGTSMDEKIVKSVILKNVKGDLDIYGGTVRRITLDDRWVEPIHAPSEYHLLAEGLWSLYRIPADARDHRPITACLSVHTPLTLYRARAGMSFSSGRNLGRTAIGMSSEALRSQTFSNYNTAPTAKLYQSNIIRLDPPPMTFIPYMIRIRLGYDDEFTGMSLSSIDLFARLCELMTKQIIYTRGVIQVNNNQLINGVEVGEFKNQLDKYADSQERYDELLRTFTGTELIEHDRFKYIAAHMLTFK